MNPATSFNPPEGNLPEWLKYDFLPNGLEQQTKTAWNRFLLRGGDRVNIAIFTPNWLPISLISVQAPRALR
jgi:hypothetical protein